MAERYGYDEDGKIMGEPIHGLLPECMLGVALQWRMRPRAVAVDARERRNRRHEEVEYKAPEAPPRRRLAQLPRPASTDNVLAWQHHAAIDTRVRGRSCLDIFGYPNG